jgi:hypothetical protein
MWQYTACVLEHHACCCDGLQSGWPGAPCRPPGQHAGSSKCVIGPQALQHWQVLHHRRRQALRCSRPRTSSRQVARSSHAAAGPSADSCLCSCCGCWRARAHLLSAAQCDTGGLCCSSGAGRWSRLVHGAAWPHAAGVGHRPSKGWPCGRPCDAVGHVMGGTGGAKDRHVRLTLQCVVGHFVARVAGGGDVAPGGVACGVVHWAPAAATSLAFSRADAQVSCRQVHVVREMLVPCIT